MKKVGILLFSLLTFIVAGYGINSNRLSKYTEEEYNEAILSMTPDEVSDYLKECNEHQHYQISILESMTDQLQVWFPNLDMWGCDIIDKTEKGYIADIYNYDIYDEIGYEVETEYIAYKTQILIKPDFSIEILPDTIEVDPKIGFCIYASNQEFACNGCRMGTYCVEYYIQEKDFYLKAAIPLFSLKDGLEGNEINRSIWEALKKWADEQENWANGEMQLDYEIMRLDNDLFSILLSGEWEPENGKTEKAAIGITVSMSDGDLLEETVFAGEGKKDSYFRYYVKDNEMFLIENKECNYLTAKKSDVQYKGYYVERKTANVYTSEGEWRGECYYDIPQIYYVVDEAETINKELKKEMGKFFNGLAQTFAEEIKNIDGIDDPSEGPGYRCNVKSRVYKNNGKEFGIEYHYKLWLEEILEEGDAVICFDVESGEILEYQDWQSEMVKKIELWKRNEDKNSKNNVEEKAHTFAIYKETVEKDIIFENILFIELDTGDIYTWGGEELEKLVLIDFFDMDEFEAADILVKNTGMDMACEKTEIEMAMDKVMAVLLQNGSHGLKLIYDGTTDLINRNYFQLSSFEDFEDHIHRDHHYYLDMESGNLYEGAENNPFLRTELYYIGNIKNRKSRNYLLLMT